MDLKKQFTIKNDAKNKRFKFKSINNDSCSYTVDYHECDAIEVNAWIVLYKAKKGEAERAELRA